MKPAARMSSAMSSPRRQAPYLLASDVVSDVVSPKHSTDDMRRHDCKEWRRQYRVVNVVREATP